MDTHPLQVLLTRGALAAHAAHQCHNDDLETLQPNFAFCPRQVIRKALENTAQLAKAVAKAPIMTWHLAPRFRWLSDEFRLLRETAWTDTIFSAAQDIVKGISLSCSGGPIRSAAAVVLLILARLFVGCDLPLALLMTLQSNISTH